MDLPLRNFIVLLTVGIAFVASVHAGEQDNEQTVVTTDAGTFVGYIYTSKAFGKDMSSRRFLKIPYAKPPVGDLRFRKPVKKEKLETPYDATEYGAACAQQPLALSGSRKPGVFERIAVSEDCLFLNIYAPNKHTTSSGKVPVMVYFHGGYFVSGTPNCYVGDVVAAYGDVIWIAVAYRLSVWGFLSTGDEHLPGNYALWDQRMAIQWVHDNIASFGGDPEAITLVGTSAGGSIVLYQSMFPGNQGLVKRGIAMSGSMTNTYAFDPNPLPGARRMGALVGCGADTSTKELADCLRSKSSEELNGALLDTNNKFIRWPFEFIPTVDGEFVPETANEIFRGASEVSKQYQNSLANVDLITGVVSAEGLLDALDFHGVKNAHQFEADRETFEQNLVPLSLRSFFREDVPDILRNVVINEYTNWDDPDNESYSRDSYVELFGDYVFNIDNFKTAELHDKVSDKNTYVYLYDVTIPRSILETPSWSGKVQHAAEMTTLLGHDVKDGFAIWLTPYQGDEPEPEQWELDMMKAHITMWTNFAKSGNPNEPEDVRSYINTTWPVYDATSQRYLHMSHHMSDNSVGKRLSARAANFWYHVLPGLLDALRGAEAGSKSNKNDYCERVGSCGP